MTIEYKSFAIEELKAEEEGGTRRIKGFGSVFNNTDTQNDIVMPGAFAKSLARRKPVLLWQHDTTQPLGLIDVAEEQPKGLYVESPIGTKGVCEYAYEQAKMGSVTGLSIGFTTKKYSIDAKKGTRSLEEVELYEVSLVTFPANARATITQVKSRPDTIRRFEEYLREGGFSHEDATTVALRGYKALTSRGEPDDDSPECLAAATERLATLLTQFKL